MSSRRSTSSFRLAVLAAAVTLWIGIVPAMAERRVALVIGNSDYVDVPTLENPRNDAEDVAAALKRLGFDTTVSLDADRAAMQAAIDDFSAKVEGADVALFYYAGHAMQHQGINYLMPVDANLTNAAGLRRMTKLNDIVSDVKRAKALRIMVIDACRDNPLTEKLEGTQVAAAGGASRSAGLAKISSRTMARAKASAAEPVTRGGDIIVYAAEAGRTAADGAGRNSPFSGAFVKYVETEGQEVVALMRRVTTSVQDETKGAQRPELSIAVPFEFYFKPGPPAPPPTVRQLVPNGKPHEINAIEAQVEAIMRPVPEQERDQTRREVMVLLSDIAARSSLKPDQIATELPQAFARLTQTRKGIEQARFLMENEPEVAPFVEIAAAAVASGRRPDMAAADAALAQAYARYGEAIKARDEANDRARANRATLSEQRGNIAMTEYRTREAADHYLAAARETPASDQINAGRLFAMAGEAFYSHGNTFFVNESLREAIRVGEEEAMRRFDLVVPVDDEQKRVLGARKGMLLAAIGDAQTKLGSRIAGYEGAKMMVDARQMYRRALDSFKVEDFPAIAMDIMDRRAERDLQFGRRMIQSSGSGNFANAIDTRRVILKYQLSDQEKYKDELFRSRNNLAYALQEGSRRNDGEEGDRQIAEAVTLLEEALESITPPYNETHRNIARANLAQALGFRAARKPGLEGQADIDRALGLFAEIDKTLTAQNDPRLWAIVKQFEAEFRRMVGERTPDRQEAFDHLKLSFEMSQGVLKVISKETAPNDWAMVCAEMGYAFVSALPIVQSDEARSTFARNATSLLNSARVILAAGAFRWDVQRIDQALKTAAAVLNPGAQAPPAKQ
jgi:uncharacterized caspase-like protein/tetratricopeptide (TPR) repeat protein